MHKQHASFVRSNYAEALLLHDDENIKAT